VRTGPCCWLMAYAGEGFDDTYQVIVPHTAISDLGEMEDEIDSIKFPN